MAARIDNRFRLFEGYTCLVAKMVVQLFLLTPTKFHLPEELSFLLSPPPPPVSFHFLLSPLAPPPPPPFSLLFLPSLFFLSVLLFFLLPLISPVLLLLPSFPHPTSFSFRASKLTNQVRTAQQKKNPVHMWQIAQVCVCVYWLWLVRR